MLDNLKEIADEMDPKAFVYFDEYIQSEQTFSNLDMALVQAAFFAPIIAFPHFYGFGSVFVQRQSTDISINSDKSMGQTNTLKVHLH